MAVLPVRLVELTFRSLSNILEHLHQSFFFYLLCDTETFISIAHYITIGILPIVALIIAAVADVARRAPAGREAFQKVLILAIFAGLNLGTMLLVQTAAQQQIGWLRLAGLVLPMLGAVGCVLLSVRVERAHWVCCLWTALAITPLLSLNFSLAVVAGLLYGIPLVLDMEHPGARLMQLITTPSVMLALLMLTGSEYAGHISKNLVGWNWGIPFFWLQPPVLLAFCSAKGGGEDKGTRVHSKQE